MFTNLQMYNFKDGSLNFELILTGYSSDHAETTSQEECLPEFYDGSFWAAVRQRIMVGLIILQNGQSYIGH